LGLLDSAQGRLFLWAIKEMNNKKIFFRIKPPELYYHCGLSDIRTPVYNNENLPDTNKIRI
jgi:hypothetical protein